MKEEGRVASGGNSTKPNETLEKNILLTIVTGTALIEE